KDGKQQAGRWELGEYRGPVAAKPANAGGMDLPSEIGDAPGLALAVEGLLREGTPAVREPYRQGTELAAPNSAPPPAGGGTAVLVDENTVWRHLHLEGPSYFMLDDPAPVVKFNGAPEIVKTAFGTMAKVGMRHGFDQSAPGEWRREWTSSAPPPDWASVTWDDSLWLRTCWPQPIPDLTRQALEEKGFLKKAQPFDTVVVLARTRFEIKDPQRVKACRISLDYWGGVVVYVNGKEAARGHLPGQEPDMLARLAEPYPEKVLPYKSPFASAGCLRQLREVEIPAAFLRPGVNVLSVEAHPAPIPYSTWKRYDEFYAWPAIGVKRARLTVAPADAAVTSGLRLQGLRVWNCAVSDTLTVGNDLRETGAPVQPVEIRAARNSVFSGRLMVGSDQPITGLTVKVSDLVRLRKSSSSSAKRSSFANARVENEDDDEDEGGGAKIPASAVRVRYAVTATPDKSWVPQGRFDGLLDQIPAEIPLCVTNTATKALAPLWFTVRVPANVTAGRYEGRITIAAQGFSPQTVPLHVQVCAWTMPDVQDWRMQNFIYHAEEVEAKYYGVTNYSARHLELVGKALAVLAEVNSRQVMANLVCDFFANGYAGSSSSNPESLV
ncbi:MAG: glycoside hydrolase domain-containing protein, partial [Lentisphaerota bacterium]